MENLLKTIWIEIKKFDIGEFILYGAILAFLAIMFNTSIWGMIAATIMFFILIKTIIGKKTIY